MGRTEKHIKHTAAEMDTTQRFFWKGSTWVGTGFFGCRRNRDLRMGARVVVLKEGGAPLARLPVEADENIISSSRRTENVQSVTIFYL